MLVADLAIGQGTKLPLERGSSLLRLAQDRLDVVGKLGDRAGRSFVAIRPFERVDLAEDVGRRFLPGRAPRLILGPLPGPGERQIVARQERSEERLEPVIVLLKDRVELVVVAAGTADAQPEEDLAGDVGDVVEDVGPLPAHVALVVLVGPQPEKAGGDLELGVVRIELVAGELLGEEAVVGLVGVERADDVVAVAPGVGANGILAIAVRLGIADQVEPVPRPSLAVPRRGQQAVDQALVGIGRIVGEERVDFLGGRGQPGQVEGRAADQGRLVGLGGGGQAVLEERLEDESVDRVALPVGPVGGP